MSLEFIYYPVSFILWCWHKVFGFIFGESTAISWVLGIMFLTFTVRGIMFKPFVNQVRSMKKMQDFAPEVKKVQKKYANDKQRQMQEMQKLQREHGVNPLGACLPMLLQIPVFIGLVHVLRTFTNLPPGQTTNYFFNEAGVQSYVNAKIFGINLGEAIHNATIVGGSGGGWNWDVAPVAIPLMIIASIATHLTARHSVARQNPANITQQSEMMSKLQLYIFPAGVLVFGAFFPVGMLVYWLANNGWTLMQQRLVYTKIDKEEAKKKADTAEKRTALGPKPGQKPQVGQKPAQSKKSGSGSTGQENQSSGRTSTNGKGSAKGGKAGSAHRFAQQQPAKKPSSAKKPETDPQAPKTRSANNNNVADNQKSGTRDNGAEVPGAVGKTTKKSGRKQR